MIMKNGSGWNRLLAAESAKQEASDRRKARIEQRKKDRPPTNKSYGAWEIHHVWPAKEGWRAVWFTDPNEPTIVGIRMWTYCMREIRTFPHEPSSCVYVSVERGAIPMIVSGGRLQLCDDADAVLAPHQNVLEELGSPPAAW